MIAPDQALFDKIRKLPPRRMAEVEDFVDFLRAREDEQRLAQAAARASAGDLRGPYRGHKLARHTHLEVYGANEHCSR